LTCSSLETVRRELRQCADPGQAAVLKRFFKTGPGEYGEGDVFIGVRVPEIRRLVRLHQDLPLGQSERLLHSPVHEERLLALCLLVRQYEGSGETLRRQIYRLYLKNLPHINNWDLVDCSAPHIVGRHLLGRSRAPLYRLAASRSLWARRIAVLATFYFIQQGDFADTLRLAKQLLGDPEDLIHKAVGWMLREVGKRSPHTAEAFLQRHCRAMPRTMLRYAVEKFPAAKRKKYLKGRG
jgi:3-methyladenine DNA glycosylase AlkD